MQVSKPKFADNEWVVVNDPYNYNAVHRNIVDVMHYSAYLDARQERMDHHDTTYHGWPLHAPHKVRRPNEAEAAKIVVLSMMEDLSPHDNVPEIGCYRRHNWYEIAVDVDE